MHAISRESARHQAPDRRQTNPERNVPMSTTRAISSEAKTTKEATLPKQYGCGPIPFTGADGLYDRHLLFDNVADLTTASARQRYEAFARSVRDVLSQRWILTE